MAWKVDIEVAGKRFPLVVQDEAEQELYRRAASVIDRTLEQRRKAFYSSPLDELLIFIAFNECKARLRLQDESDLLKEELDALQAQLADYLEKTEQP